MKTVARALLTLFVFAAAAHGADRDYKTRFITSATLTIHVQDGRFITIRNFTQDKDVGQGRGVIMAGVPAPSPTPTPTATATPTPALSTNAGPGVALGATLNDTAVIFFGNNPNGMITFTLFDPSNLPVYTDVVTVSGNATYNTTSSGNNPGGFTPATTGTYKWTALYSNDTNGNPSVMDNGQNETVVVTTTPTPAPSPTPTPTPTLLTSGVLTAAILNPVATVNGPPNPPPTGESIHPIIIAGPATLTIQPVSGATLAITYKKGLQPIQPTTTATVAASSTSTFSATTTLSAGTSTRSTSVIENGTAGDDDIEWSTPSQKQRPSPTVTPTPTATPITSGGTPTPTPTIIPSPSPTP